MPSIGPILVLLLAALLGPSPRGASALVAPPRGLGPPSPRILGLRSSPSASTAPASDSATALHYKRRRRRTRRPRHGVEMDDLEDCRILDREDLDHQGLAKNIDVEYAAEEDKLKLTFWDVYRRELKRPETYKWRSEKSKNMTAWDRAKRRMVYAKGNVESKYVLMSDRSYGVADLLDRDHLDNPPTMDDLNVQPAPFKDKYWSSPLFRIGVVLTSYLAYPLFLSVLVRFQTIDPDDFDIVVGQIAPNVGVLYATILALTLQVLYGRFTRIQENVTTEAMLLSQVTRNLLSLFAQEREWAVEACQMVAIQVRIMLSRTRGVELLSIMKSDTYANLLAIVDDFHYLHGCDDDFTPQEESITSMLRGEIGQLMEVRALRLSDEASSLPPTHFTLITSLSFVSIVAYVTASIKVVGDLMHPPQEASLLFAGLMALYVLFYNFCKDLNGPFSGVYQIKRSNAVSHLMQTKWLIVSQLGNDVSFSSNYDGELAPAEGEEEASFFDDIKAFFSGGSENTVAAEAEAVQTLVDELESDLETIGQEGDLCDALPATPYLDCNNDERETRLFQLQDELARLRLLNEQLRNGIEVSPEMSGPEARLHRMEQELGRLKELNRQVSQGVVMPTEEHGHGGSEGHSSMPSGSSGRLSSARAALEHASMEMATAKKALEDSAKAEVQENMEMVEGRVTAIQEKATGVTFDPKLDDFYLVGAGVRKRAFVNIYAVAMYSSFPTLEAISQLSPGKDAQAALRNAAGTFNGSSSKTSFVLEMNFKADADTIAGAIADSVKPRYSGPPADVKWLETLISEGVKSKGGQATKGTVFRFDCSAKGVSVSVDGNMQGTAAFEGMGGAFVDVFTDDRAVSPKLVDSCLNTWCGSDIHKQKEKGKQRIDALLKRAHDARTREEEARKLVDDLEAQQKEAAQVAVLTKPKPQDEKLLENAEKSFMEEQAKLKREEDRKREEAAAEQAAEEARKKAAAMEAKLLPLKERSTGVTFDPKLGEATYLVGVGVRKKSIINVYALAMYSSIAALEALSAFPRGKQKQEARAALRNAARTFGAASPSTTFILEMVFKADAQTIAGAIAEGVKPRYGGSASDVKELEALIVDGVKGKGGQATKGTVFRFDCTNEGVSVSVDGKLQGTAGFEGLGSAFVDVFTDDRAVSPQLIESSLETWCGSNLT